MDGRVGVSYLVIWKDDYLPMQSEVILLDTQDPNSLSANDWVSLAAKSEDYSDVEVRDMLDNGYDLYLVCDMPSKFYI